LAESFSANRPPTSNLQTDLRPPTSPSQPPIPHSRGFLPSQRDLPAVADDRGALVHHRPRPLQPEAHLPLPPRRRHRSRGPRSAVRLGVTRPSDPEPVAQPSATRTHLAMHVSSGRAEGKGSRFHAAHDFHPRSRPPVWTFPDQRLNQPKRRIGTDSLMRISPFLRRWSIRPGSPPGG